MHISIDADGPGRCRVSCHFLFTRWQVGWMAEWFFGVLPNVEHIYSRISVLRPFREYMYGPYSTFSHVVHIYFEFVHIVLAFADTFLSYFLIFVLSGVKHAL